MKLHLPKRLFAALMATFAVCFSTTIGADIISVNFGTSDEPIAADATEPINGSTSARWNNIVGNQTDVNGTHILKSENVDAVGTLTLNTPQNTWGSNNAVRNQTLTSQMQSSYLDLSSGNKWQIDLSTDFMCSDVVLYFSGDGNKYAPVLVNGTSYVGGTNVKGNSEWGDRSLAASATISDNNRIIVTDVRGLIHMENVPMSDTGKRATLSGLQVVEADTWSAALAAGNNTFSAISWTLGGTTSAADAITEGDRWLKAAADASGSTIVFSEAPALQGLQVSSGTLTLNSASGVTVTLPTLWASAGATMDVASTLATGSDLNLGGSGTIRFTANQVLDDLNVGSNIALADGVVIEVTGTYTHLGGTITQGNGSGIYTSVAANTEYTSGNVTIQSTQDFKRNCIDTQSKNVMLAENADVRVSFAGSDIVSFSKSPSVAGSLNVNMVDLSLADNSTMELRAGEGVSVVGNYAATDTPNLYLNSGKTLVVGNGVSLTYASTLTPEEIGGSGSQSDITRFGIGMSNAVLVVDGGTVTSDSIGASNEGWPSTLEVKNGGLLNITGEVDAGHKNGSVRLAHWGVTTTFNMDHGGEFRVLNAIANIGDDGRTHLTANNASVINLKGLRMANNCRVNINSGSMLNLGVSGITNPTNNANTGFTVTGGVLGALSSEGWSAAQDITLNTDSTIQLAVYDVDTKTYSGAANITLSGALKGDGGSLTLAGDGVLTVSSSLKNAVHVAEGASASLVLAESVNLNNLYELGGYTGYGSSTTDGYATSGGYRVAGIGSTISQATVGGELRDVVDGVVVGEISEADKAIFRVNTTVNLTDDYKDMAGVTALVAPNATLTLSGTEAHTLGTIDSNGSTTVSVDTTLEHLKIAAGTTFVVNNGAELSLTARDDRSIKGNVTITGAGSKLTIASQGQSDHIVYYHNQNNAQTITVSDGGTLDIGANRWTVSANTTFTLNNGTITGTGQDATTHPCVLHYIESATINSAGTSRIEGGLRINGGHALTLNVTDGSLTIEDTAFTSDKDGSIINKSGNGALVLNQGFILKGGLNVTGGAVQVGAALNLGGTSTLGSAFSLATGGSLTTQDNAVLNITTTIAGAAGTSVNLGAANTINLTSLDGLKAAPLGGKNGFAQANYYLISGATVTLNNTTVKIGEEVQTANTEDGGLYITVDDTATYWVTEAGNAVTWNDQDADMSSAELFYVTETGVFNVASGSNLTKNVTNYGVVNLEGDASYLEKVTNADDGVVNITSGGNTVLSLSGDFAGGTMPISIITEDGKTIVTGSDNSSTFLGDVTIKSGYTLRGGSDAGCFGKDHYEAASANRYLIVEGGATLDAGGKPLYYQVKLQDGALLTNTANDSGSDQHRQLPKIVLEGNATVHTIGGIEGDENGYEIRMVGSGYGATELLLNGHTLTKTGTGYFYMSNTTANAGALDIQEGAVEFTSGRCAMSEVDVTLAENAQLIINTNQNNVSTVKSLSGSGTLFLRTSGYLTVAGGDAPSTVDLGGIRVGSNAGHSARLNLGANVTLNATTITNGTLWLGGSGTYDIGSATTLTKTTLSEDWTGTVKVSNAVISAETSLANLVRTDASSLTLSGLTVNDGAALTLAGDVTLGGTVTLAESIANGGALTFGSDLVLDLTGMDSVAGTGGDEKIITLLTGAGTHNLTSLTESMLSAATKALGTDWKFNADGTISFTDLHASPDLTWNGGDGSLSDNNYQGGNYEDGSDITFGANGDGNADAIAVEAGDHLRSATITGGEYNFTGEQLAVSGNISIAESATVSVEGGIAVGGTLSSTGALSTGTISGAGSVDISGGSLELSGANAIATTGATKSISGTVLKGSWGATGVTIGSGTAADGTGATTVDTGASITLTDSTLAGTIANNGTLTLSGTVTLKTAGFNKQTTGVGYSDGGNGFRFATALYTVAEGGTLNTDGVTSWSADTATRATGAISYANGIVTIQGEQQGTGYWVNTGTVTYDAGTAFSGATSLELNGGKLVLASTLDEALTGGLVLNNNSALEISSGISLARSAISMAENVTGKTLTLSGAGIYDLADARDLGSGVTLDSSWTGKVKLTGSTLNGQSLDTFANAQSTVELCGVSGYLSQANNTARTYAGNIILTNNGNTVAWNINNGWNNDTRTFEGTISGTGTLKRSSNLGTVQNIIFAGDTSGWTGALVHEPNYAANSGATVKTNVTFSGSQLINVAMSTNGKGEFNITLDDAHLVTPATVKTMASISATTLSVTEGTQVELGASTTLNSIAGAAGSSIAATGALTLLNGASSVADFATSGGLTLGKAGTTPTHATLDVDGMLTLGGILTLNTMESGITAGSLAMADATVDVTAILSSLATENGAACTLITLDTAFGSTTLPTLTGVDADTAKLYDVSLGWNTAGTELSVTATKKGHTWDTETAWSELGASAGDNVWLSGAGSSTVTMDAAGSASSLVVNPDASAATQAYTLTGDALTVNELQVNSGALTVDNMTTVNTDAAVDGALSITQNGELHILGSMDAEGVSITNDGKLLLHKGSLGGLVGTDGAAAGSLEIVDAVVASGVEDGNVSIDGDVVLNTLANAGQLTVDGSFTLNNATTQGGTLTAEEVTLKAAGNTFTSITTDTLHIGALDATKTVLKADTLAAATEGGDITLVLDALVPATPAKGAAEYGIIEATNGLDAVNTVVNTNEEWQKYLYENRSQKLTATAQNGKLNLTVESDIPDTWNTSKQWSENGLLIEATGSTTPVKDYYSILDGMAGVHVDADKTIDLTALTADADGLVIKNLTGDSGKTLSLVGDAADSATLTNSKESAGAALTADGLKLSVDTDAPQGLTTLTAQNGAAVEVNGLMNAATINLADTASSLAVRGTASTSSLKGTGSISGKLLISGNADVPAGHFSGTYNAAEIAMVGGQQTLAAKDGLTVSGTNGTATLEYDSSTRMDAIKTTGATVVLDRTADATLTLDEASSMKGGELKFNLIGYELAMGSVDVIDGTLNLTNGTKVTIGTEGDDATLDIDRIGDTLAILGNGNTAGAEVTLVGDALNKYFANATVQNGVVKVDRNTSYASSRIETETANGTAGASLLDDILVSLNPQADPTGAYADLSRLMDAVDADTVTDEAAAAVAGASTAIMSVALSGDVERQMRAIRNRTTTMGVDQSVVNEDMPYLNAWINAEGDYSEMDSDGTAAGYTLNSYGGTVGFDVDCTPEFTFGMALTAMYGDLEADGPDKAEGNLDTYYVSAFARYAASAWTHTFVATMGLADLSLDRTVSYNGGSYKTQGNTDGTAFGLMYEVGRVFALNEDASTCLQPILNLSFRHSSVGAYSETGSDAGLKVDDQTYTTFTAGLGARIQTIIGESIYNRTSILEARLMAKLDAGDTEGESTVQFLNGARSAKVNSAELGAFGAEAGVGLTIPVGQEGGSIFLDASAEIRDAYINLNGTVGYRINF